MSRITSGHVWAINLSTCVCKVRCGGNSLQRTQPKNYQPTFMAKSLQKKKRSIWTGIYEGFPVVHVEWPRYYEQCLPWMRLWRVHNNSVIEIHALILRVPLYYRGPRSLTCLNVVFEQRVQFPPRPKATCNAAVLTGCWGRCPKTCAIGLLMRHVWSAITKPLSRQALCIASALATHGNWVPSGLKLKCKGLGGGLPLDMRHASLMPMNRPPPMG